MRYDLLYVVPSTTDDAPTSEVKAKVNEMLQAINATIIQEDEPGKRKLAYPINNVRHGYYVNVIFEAEPQALIKFKKSIGLNTDIVRFQIVQEEKTAGKANLKKMQKAAQRSAKAAASSPARSEGKEEPAGSKVSLQELDKKLEELLSDEVK